MNTNFPTVTLYFGFAFTFCKLQVYKKDEDFARKILDAARVEWMNEEDCPSNRRPDDRWQEFDTRVLLSVIREALPKIISAKVEGL